MHRDQDILDYHTDADLLNLYEDPHYHAPSHERYDQDPILNEYRPDDEDFNHYELLDHYYYSDPSFDELSHDHEEHEVVFEPLIPGQVHEPKHESAHHYGPEDLDHEKHHEKVVPELKHDHQVDSELHGVKKQDAKATTAPKTAPAAATKTPAVNETPMYVRPYLEDPIFLQPDDDEVSLLHPDLAHADDHHDYDESHDLVGDPDLEYEHYYSH